MIFFCLKIRSIRFETSISATGIRCSAISTTETFTPKLLKILAHSVPIAPEPTINTDSGSSFNSKISSELKINSPSNSNPFISLGTEPVASIILSTLYSSPPAVIFFPLTHASSYITVTPEFFTASSRDFLTFSTV